MSMRTIKRHTLSLNLGKEKSLQELCQAYTREKRFWLNHLKGWRFQGLLGSARTIRDEFIELEYASLYGLQARHWKLALQDAVEIWDKYWQAIFVLIRPRIQEYFKDETERHYAFWLLKSYVQFAELMQGKTPLPYFVIEKSRRDRVAAYVQRIIKRVRGKSPSIKKARTIKFDADCYTVIEHQGRQYLKLMSLERGKRIILPLKGHTCIQGTITVVIGDEVVVHVSQDLKPTTQGGNTLEAVDFGYTEVMVDTAGTSYGKALGSILTKASDEQHLKMQKRHKLHALEKKYRQTDPKKAKKIRRYNLGKKCLETERGQVRQTIEREINTAINELIEQKRPDILVTEDLRHHFSFNKAKSINRKLSSWVRGKIQDRVGFKALAKGFRHEQVHPAYGSQTCPHCGFVDRRNRSADKFKCLFCRHEDIADRVAALNYAKRYGDEGIGLYMPYNQVKTILLG
jgi:putative transposase